MFQERTEEKKKIFELAGGGQKKRSGMGKLTGTKAQPRKQGQYIPEVEAKRREPWRVHYGTDNNMSLCPTDEPPSSLNSPTSPGSPPSQRKRSGAAYLDRTVQMGKTSSLTSLNEESSDSNLMTKSMPSARIERIERTDSPPKERNARTPDELR